MKVLLVHKSDRGVGGGNIAMNRLHSGLLKAGVDSRILCQKATTQATDRAVVIPRSATMARAETVLHRGLVRLGVNDLHALSSFSVKAVEAVRAADVIDFHCIHGGFFNYLALPSLTKGKAAVFTLHDMWPFTGHCHNSLDCERWRTGCGKCPYPDTAPAVQRDATRIEWALKEWVYTTSYMHVVAPSRWLADCTKQSMLGRFPIHHVPHGIDLEVFRPLDAERCRVELGIPPNRWIIMVSAASLNAPLKGGHLLVEALRMLPEHVRQESVLLLLGRNGSRLASEAGIPAVDLDYVDDDRVKAVAYSAAHVFVHPSRAENLPLVLLESLACGTPTVAFGVGGVPDLVRHGITGYLAQPEDPADLCRGIVQTLEDESQRKFLSRNCRIIAEKEYSLDLQVERYLEVYRLARDKRAAERGSKRGHVRLPMEEAMPV